MNGDGGAAMPVALATTNMLEGGAAIPVIGVFDPTFSGYPVLGQLAKQVVVIDDADLIENGGKFWLDGRVSALPVWADTSGVTEGNVPIPIYIAGFLP